jgi:hypothetical protein
MHPFLQAIIPVVFIPSVIAQDIQSLPAVVVEGKAENLLGEAAGASQGQASADEIASRPLLRRGEILEVVPGMITTQHAGGGKATQFFLRGYNLDHGTDFATSIDRMPLNMRSHAHGQGYTDLNGLIPELVERVDYVKGTYTARNGDMSTAGSADFKLWDVLPTSLASVEIGEHDYYRGLLAGTVSLGGAGIAQPGADPMAKNPPAAAISQPNQHLTYAYEYNHYDGPWDRPENFNRHNGFLRYFVGDADEYFSVTAMSYLGKWSSSDQIAKRAVAEGLITRWGSLDSTTGGESQRYSLQFDGQAVGNDTTTRASAYGFYYDLDLFSNFTYRLDDPIRGDQFEQQDGRWVYGGELTREWTNRKLFGREAAFTAGLQTRHDVVDDIGLYKTQRRQRHQVVRVDDIYQGNVGLFGESVVRWTPWMRTVAGLRADAFWFDVESDQPANSGDDLAGIVSPKMSAIFGPWAETEVYLNFGTGFHSNDARGVTNTRDPLTGDPLDPVDPLVRTMGAEIGVRTQVVPDVTSSLALWWLDSDSELVYVGDAGVNEAGPASRRYGIEWTNYWRPTDWFQFDAEIALSHGRFRGVGEDDEIPNSIPAVFSGGVVVGRESGLFGSLRARAFAPRPLEESGTIEGKSTFTLNGEVGWRRKNWEVAVGCFNILDRDDNDIEYYYASRLDGEGPAGVEDTHFHPAEPRSFRLRLTYRF